jgi:hypothetical protein
MPGAFSAAADVSSQHFHRASRGSASADNNPPVPNLQAASTLTPSAPSWAVAAKLQQSLQGSGAVSMLNATAERRRRLALAAAVARQQVQLGVEPPTAAPAAAAVSTSAQASAPEAVDAVKVELGRWMDRLADQNQQLQAAVVGQQEQLQKQQVRSLVVMPPESDTAPGTNPIGLLCRHSYSRFWRRAGQQRQLSWLDSLQQPHRQAAAGLQQALPRCQARRTPPGEQGPMCMLARCNTQRHADTRRLGHNIASSNGRTLWNQHQQCILALASVLVGTAVSSTDSPMPPSH